VICGTAGGYVIYGAGGGILFVEFTKVAGGWLWRNGRTDSMTEVELD
jgi:hypothetical protein